jgi:hypothetical protein
MLNLDGLVRSVPRGLALILPLMKPKGRSPSLGNRPLTCTYLVAGEDLNLRPLGYEFSSTCLLLIFTYRIYELTCR